ncbi:alkylphosphonate utilization protein [Paracoccus aestuariivivens]|uniref:Alkylphosphonate utilization protein n=1 Tax=Paracoccus aestuariivivens TaxID=1820333 RepID=A0A6L6J6H3_9RHOB|nr:alkylphosphonate utilization protein [Paracoccus aestuariivivens]MTH76207.1 alkylphosphonate utilization protein [Paracoccus aestuariivivens]
MPLLPPLRLVGATILRDGELRQRSVAIARGKISKGPLPAVDLDGYLILPGIIDLLHRPHPVRSETARRAVSAGITTAWLTPAWSWQAAPDAPWRDKEILRGIQRPALPDMRPAISIESYRTDCTQRLIDLARDFRIELAWFESSFARLQDLRQHDPHGFTHESLRQGLSCDELAPALDSAAERRREVPRHLCRLAEAFDELGIRYGSIGDTGGAMRETHSMIGAGLAACPAAHSAAAAARAMGDPVLLAASDEDRMRDLLRSGLGDAVVSDGAPERIVPLALSLAGSDLAGLPRIWAMLSTRPAEIMRLADRGRLDHGCRADLAIISPETGRLEATISAGHLAYLSGDARRRFAEAGVLPVSEGRAIAAE